MSYLACTDNSYLLRRAQTQDTWARDGGGTATDFERRAGAGELRRTVVHALSVVGESATLAAPYMLHPFPSHPIILPWVLLVISFSLVYGNQGLFRVLYTSWMYAPYAFQNNRVLRLNGLGFLVYIYSYKVYKG